MENAYRIFFQIYGGLHIVAGILIALLPCLLAPALSNQIDQGAGVLIGTLSLMTGLGFYGAAYVKEIKPQLLFVKLAFLANIANGLAHLSNALTGAAPAYMAYIGIPGTLVFMVILAIIHGKLSSRENHSPCI